MRKLWKKEIMTKEKKYLKREDTGSMISQNKERTK